MQPGRPCAVRPPQDPRGRPLSLDKSGEGASGSNPSLATMAPPPVAAPKIRQTRIQTDASKLGTSCVTIGPLTVSTTLCVPTACSLLSKNF